VIFWAYDEKEYFVPQFSCKKFKLAKKNAKRKIGKSIKGRENKKRG
jgi:hypothetical protein